MNIFFLDKCLYRCVDKYHYKHLIKIILEICQMMYSDFGGDPEHDMLFGKPYRRTHANHPMTRWVNATPHNYLVAGAIGLILCKRYTSEYKRQHACEARIRWLVKHRTMNMRGQVGSGYECKCSHKVCSVLRGCTPIPQCMPDVCKREDTFDAYVVYYDEVKIPKLG